MLNIIYQIFIDINSFKHVVLLLILGYTSLFNHDPIISNNQIFYNIISLWFLLLKRKKVLFIKLEFLNTQKLLT